MTAATAWLPPPTDLALGLALSTDLVHVWRLPLTQPPAQLAVLAQTLGDEERARARRFHFDRDRDAFTCARGALRTLAGRYLAQRPDALGFGYRARGKPYLTAPPGDSLQFNVSHSGELALLAFTRGREVGVDVERRRPLQDLRSLAQTSFSPAEYAALLGVPADDQTDAFYACWSRKEAFIKATGEGIAQLAEFDVTVRADEPARLLRVPGGAAAGPRWSMRDLPAIPGYAAALVIDGHEVRIACWDWPPGGVAALPP